MKISSGLWSCIPGFSDPAKMNLNTDHLKRCIETLRLSLIMSIDAVERWFAYRDNRNNTAHDYGENFAKETLCLMQRKDACNPFLHEIAGDFALRIGCGGMYCCQQNERRICMCLP